MGSLILGEAWLLQLAEQSASTRRIAARLLRMQILTANRSGHVLYLGWEPYRDQIADATHWGKVAGLVVECADCHCQAVLHQWETAALLTSAGRKTLWQSQRPLYPRAVLAYLAKCPGSVVAGLLASSPALPKKGDVLP